MFKGIEDKELHINAGCVAAYLYWVSTTVLLTLGTVFDYPALHSWGLASSALAATATIRMYFVAQNVMLRRAFEYGREQGRTEADTVVTPLMR